MKNNIVTLFAHKCAYQDGKLYCFANFNLLFSIDLQDGTIELMDAVPEENILSNYLFGSMNIWNNKVILGPNMAKKIWIYDLTSRHWESLSVNLSINGDESLETGKIHQIYTYKNLIYMIGSSYPAILCVDLENNSCDYIEDPYKEVKDRHPDINFYYFLIHGVQLENNLYLASSLDNYVLKFDMETRKHQWIKVGNDNYVYSGITWDGSSFWLSPRLNCDIVRWDGKEKTKIIPLPPELKPAVQTYTWAACYDDDHVIFPCMSHPKSIVIDIQRDNFQILDQQYMIYTRLDNGMVVSQTIEGDLSIKTAGDSSAKIFRPTVKMEELLHFYKEKGRKILVPQTLYNEKQKGQLLSLENYLDFIELKESDQSAANGPIGKAIWESIR